MSYKTLLVLTFLATSIPVAVFAQTANTPPPFVTMVGIPGVTANSTNIGEYINTLYTLSISIAALLAVIKMIIAGAKYMLSDMVTSKADAKKDIQGALLGLLIVISAVVVLQTINPQLRLLNIVFTPITEVPGRAVRDTPTTNSQAPLPGVVRGEGDIVTQCSSPQSCTEAATACYNSAPNTRVAQGVTSSGSTVTCTSATTANYSCVTSQRNGTTDCRTATNLCQSRGGQVVANMPSSNLITCSIPHPVRPNAGGTNGTRGGA